MDGLQKGLALLLVATLVCSPSALVRRGFAQDTSGAAQGQTFGREQLEQLVAPIALYPDSLVAQILMAATYPIEGPGGGQPRDLQRSAGQQRPGSPGAQRGGYDRQAAARRDSNAFGGVGNGQAARQQSNRGQASRQSAMSRGGGGGYHGGGGGRGGGGGGRR